MPHTPAIEHAAQKSRTSGARLMRRCYRAAKPVACCLQAPQSLDQMRTKYKRFFVRKRPKRFFTRARACVQVGFCCFENLEFARQYAKNLFFSCSVIAAP
jgi:hypothetical protein